MQIDALGARPFLEERAAAQMDGLTRGALGHDREHFVAARGALDMVEAITAISTPENA